MNRLALGAALGVGATVLLCGPAVMVGVAAFTADPTMVALSSCDRTVVAEQGGVPVVAGFTPVQVRNAQTIVRAGQKAGVPARGWVVAVATAMQESNLRNLANPRVPASMGLPHEGTGTDHDSVGLFQQRQSWGTAAELMNPEQSAAKFYAALNRVPSWLGLPLTVAAQKVQRSAFPSAYAKHEQKAAALVDAISGGVANSGTTDQCATGAEVTASGWTNPVAAKLGSRFRTAERPTHNGVDLMAPKGTPIRAASAGTVIRAVCDPGTADTVGTCDKDGWPTARGCGWYVDLKHAAGAITRYCHMASKPLVAVGQTVTVGQQLGVVGSSGRSSGPHLHFETHTNDNPSKTGAVEPVAFMKARGVNLNG